MNINTIETERLSVKTQWSTIWVSIWEIWALRPWNLLCSQ